jgi:hypothetical protein
MMREMWASKIAKGTSKTGKGTTSVVPYRAAKDEALAAEGPAVLRFII